MAKKLPDGEVLVHPGFREIPPCRFTMQTDVAKVEYDKIAERLFRSGRLTEDVHMRLSEYALLMDSIEMNSRAGKAPRSSAVRELGLRRNGLKLSDDRPIAAPEGEAVNEFAENGFAARGRSAIQAR